ncbi:hypothetical protein FHU33_1680 [Blastococcus colisei]|uniref:Uncharacterized protein n=1 Tax=Blastococcus colisei TaxID=1564162 RepID=A0A543PDY2_9ACTN|nr:hypothetical protein [Blastococcus colisei]TQN42285.1 hypothetical protein FHU33_1680 [Blastococcus colisei]
MPELRIAQDDAADDRLGRDPLALLIGMLLDQHVRRRSSRLVFPGAMQAGVWV